MYVASLRLARLRTFASSNFYSYWVMRMSGKRQLQTKCPVCGQALTVLTRQDRPSEERPGERVEVPFGKPICPVGHVYRMGPDESHPE